MNVEVLDQVVVLHIDGNILDETASVNILSYYENEVKDLKNKNLIVDLSKVNVINSIGLSVLIRLLTKTRIKGGEMLLIGLNQKVKQVLQLTKLNDVFQISEDLNQAINILNQSK